MRLYYGRTPEDKEYIGDFITEEEANKEMISFLTKKGFDNLWYWRMWYSEDGSFKTFDFGSWSFFFFLYF